MASKRKKDKCGVIAEPLCDVDEYAQVYISEALRSIKEYENSDADERDAEALISELDCVEEMLDEYADDSEWNGYWRAVEAISFLAQYNGVGWASPYEYCILDNGKYRDVERIEAFHDDVEVIRKVAKLRGVMMPYVVQEFACLLRKKYAKELAAGRDDDADRPHRRVAVWRFRSRDEDILRLDIRRREKQGVDAVHLPQEEPVPESEETELQAHLRTRGQSRNRQVVFYRRRGFHRRLYVQN